MFSSEIPAPGSKAVAIVKSGSDGFKVLQVHIYPPSGERFITMDGSFFEDTYATEDEVRADVGKAVNNNPVRTIDIEDIQA